MFLNLSSIFVMNRFYYLDSYNGEHEDDIWFDFDNQESAVTTALV